MYVYLCVCVFTYIGFDLILYEKRISFMSKIYAREDVIFFIVFLYFKINLHIHPRFQILRNFANDNIWSKK